MSVSPRHWLDDLIRQHDERIARRGREYIGRVRRLSYEPRQGVVNCEVAGSGDEPYTVTLRPPNRNIRGSKRWARRSTENDKTLFDPLSSIIVPPPPAATDALDASCTCPYSEVGRFLCKHTFAAATRLAELWDARPAADLAELLCGQDGAFGWSARPLQLLEAFLHDVTEEGEAATEPTGRLCWLVKPHRGGPFGAGLSVRAVAETWLGGRWRRSEPLPWDRLLASLDSPDLVATPQDRGAILAVRRDKQSYGFHSGKNLWTVDAFSLVAALVGHPRVFLVGRDGGPIEVVDGKLGLAVVARDDGFGVVPAVNGDAVELASHRRAEKGVDLTTFFPGLSGVIALDRAKGRLTVAEAEPKARRLVASLRPEETVPFLEIEELVNRLVRIEPVLPVAWPEELRGDRSPADPTIRIRLERLQPFGLSMRLVVRPAEASESYPPGLGPAVVAVCEWGRRTERVRDLDGERRTAEQIVNCLDLAVQARPKPWRWVIEGPEAALGLIERLGKLDPPLSVAEWPADDPVRIVGIASASSLTIRISDARDWFRLDGGAAVGGHTVPLSDLLEAVSENRSFVRLNGADWVRLGDDLRQVLVRLAAVSPLGSSSGSTSPGAVFIARSAAPAAAEALRDVAVEITRSWSEIAEAAQCLGEAELPLGFSGTLRTYQVEGYRWLVRRSDADLGCCLADEMGLGKTIQTLAVLLRRATRGPALITPPTSVEQNWLDEVRRFTPTLRVYRLRDFGHREIANLGPGDLLVASHALLRLHAEQLSTVPWATLVIDEAHAVKNRETRLAEAVRKLRPAWTLALTGTPVENHPGELWAIFHLLAPDLLGPWTRFRKRFVEPVVQGDLAARDALRRLVGPYLLRRTKDEVLPELPPCIEMVRFVSPNEEQFSFYDRVRRDALAELKTGKDPRRLLAALTRLRQIAAHPALVDRSWSVGSPKLDAILTLVGELRVQARRPLVFSPFARHLKLIAAGIEGCGFRPLLLTGSTPEADRALIVASFQQGEGDALLVSLKAGGTGLNLTAAETVLIADPWWNPAAESQAAGRAHRIGQDRPVTVVRFAVRGTVEEEMLRLQAAKRELAAGLLTGADRPGDSELPLLLSPASDRVVA